MNRPLLVGESNPYSTDDRCALLPWPRQAAGNRLREILGLTDREYLRLFDRCNLVVGKRWSMKEARAAAERIRSRPGSIVLLGRKVASAFGFTDRPFSVVLRGDGSSGVFVLLPHPSGLCHEWNDPAAARRARELVVPLLIRELL